MAKDQLRIELDYTYTYGQFTVFFYGDRVFVGKRDYPILCTLDRLSKSTMTEQAAASKRAAQEKRRAEKRLTELDNLLAKIYEDRVNEKITERNFSMLSQKYQQEQGELEKKIEALTAQLASTKEQEDGINKWVELIKQFSSPTELTADMLNTLIEKILVHEATKDEDGNRVQEIEIVYRFVGKID